jgi:hypothetical protein
LKAADEVDDGMRTTNFVRLDCFQVCLVPLTEVVMVDALGRIPVRPAPKGYGPELGVTRVESSLFPQSKMRVGCMFSVTCGSKTHHFCSDNPEDAGDWVQAIKSSWHHCVTHSSRRIQTADKAELQVMTLQPPLPCVTTLCSIIIMWLTDMD